MRQFRGAPEPSRATGNVLTILTIVSETSDYTWNHERRRDNGTSDPIKRNYSCRRKKQRNLPVLLFGSRACLGSCAASCVEICKTIMEVKFTVYSYFQYFCVLDT